jgi:hypothetical protein
MNYVCFVLFANKLKVQWILNTSVQRPISWATFYYEKKKKPINPDAYI